MTDLKDKTVAEIVTEDIATASIFKKNGIDFCCGGKVKLSDVCLKKEIDIEQIEAQLSGIMDKEAVATSDNPNDWELSDLADHIDRKHHVYLKENLPVIVEFANKVAKVHGHGAPEVVKVASVVNELAQELLQHLMKEEVILFPFIKQMEGATSRTELDGPCFGSIGNPIHAMEHEHDTAGNSLAKLRELTNDYQPPEWACNTYRALYHMLSELEEDTHMHIHLENNILFPKAIELEASLN